MSGSQIVTDGLWRCLCPSFDSIIRLQLKRPVIPSITALPSSPAACSISHLSSKSSRSFHTTASSKNQPDVVREVIQSENPKQPTSVEETGNRHSFVRKYQYQVPKVRKHLTWGERTRNPTFAFAKNIDNAPPSQLREILSRNAQQEGKYIRIVNLVTQLVENRGEKPSLAHYDALIRANADAERGSAEAAETLFREMKAHGIEPDSAIYHGLLQVLAVHPDYLFRAEIVKEMKSRWIELSDEGLCYHFIGLLRDHQYEVAMDKLEAMQREGKTIHPWMYDIFICVLCEAEEFDEAINILKYRESQGELSISNNIWYFVLDICSSNYHYEGTVYSWRKKVELDHINPSDGMCLNVLNTASRHGDSNLATDVIRVLATRGVRLDHSHYEALIAAHVKANDLTTAFRLLCIMNKGGLEPTATTTRSLYTHFFNYNDRPEKGIRIIKQLKEQGHSIPIAAMNVMLEVCTSINQFDQAVEYYLELHEIRDRKPDTMTFNILLRACAKRGGSKELAMFFAEEMKALHVRPNKFTYDWLIITCLQSGPDYEDAFKYLEEMRRVFEQEKPMIETWYALLARCAKEHDGRYFDILKQMEALGQHTEDLKSIPKVQWTDEKKPKRLTSSS